jgi:hypothetical protein
MNTTLLISVLTALTAIVTIATKLLEFASAIFNKKSATNVPNPQNANSMPNQTISVVLRSLFIFNSLLALGSTLFLLWLAVGPQSEDPITVGLAAFIGVLCIQVSSPSRYRIDR